MLQARNLPTCTLSLITSPYIFVSVKALAKKYNTAKFIKICQSTSINDLAFVSYPIASPIFDLSDRLEATEEELENARVKGSDLLTIDNYAIYTGGSSYYNTTMKMSSFIPIGKLIDKTLKIYYNETFHSVALYTDNHANSCIYTFPTKTGRADVSVSKLAKEHTTAKYIRICQPKLLADELIIVNDNVASYVNDSEAQQNTIKNAVD